MKTKEELKKELHALIDSIDDAEILHVLHDDIAPYVAGGVAADTEEDALTPEQLRDLDEAIKQADEGKVISLEEFYRRMAKWHIQ